MPLAKLSDSDFIAMIEQHGITETARRTNSKMRGVYGRRERLEKKLGRQIKTPDQTVRSTRVANLHPQWHNLTVDNGIVLVGSDAHFWPGEPTTAWRAFVAFAKEHRPKAVILNGDVIDGAKISRHPPINWEKRPELADEIENAKERLHELELAVPRKCPLIWPLGNHDSRLETRIATVAPEYAKVRGVHLKDHFPSWTPCWSACINESVVVKHRFKGGIHALHNNVLWSGRHIITSHLHSLNVRAHCDYNGMRFAADTGTLAEPYSAPFLYTEDNPLNWRSGFIVLTFIDGQLQWPEVVYRVSEGVVGFRGQQIEV